MHKIKMLLIKGKNKDMKKIIANEEKYITKIVLKIKKTLKLIRVNLFLK